MRLRFAQFAFALLLWSAVLAPRAAAQNPDTMMPEANVARARQILGELINALGGPAYLNVSESNCTGRRAVFGHNGEVTGYIPFADERRYPDKQRIEYSAKGHNGIIGSIIGIDEIFITHGGTVITLFNGDQGWTIDRKGGVTDLPATSVSEFQEETKRNIDNLLRLRLKEEGMQFRYAGTDTVDLKQVDWVELVDRDQRTFRLAVDQTTHLLVRSVVITTDETYHQRDEDVTIYTNYQWKTGVQVPLQLSREHNGRRNYQGFFESCNFNPNFSDDLFTRDGLQKRGSELGEKKK